MSDEDLDIAALWSFNSSEYKVARELKKTNGVIPKSTRVRYAPYIDTHNNGN